MNPIISRRHIVKFYLLTLFGFGLWISIAFNIFIKGKDGYAIWYSISLLLAIAGFYIFTLCFKHAPIIYVDDKIIKFNREVYYWNEIKEIQLTGKQPYKFSLYHNMEGMCLRFANGKALYAFDHNYTNLWEIKSFIQYVIIDKAEIYLQTTDKINKDELEHFHYVKGNVFFSFRGLVAWFYPLFLLGLLIFDDRGFNSNAIFPVSFFCLVWLFCTSFFTYYFGISENYLVIKNHTFLWIKKPIAYDDIKEVILETRPRWPNCLRVITKDFKNRLYPAGTLTDKKWRELLTVLRKNKVKVKNHIGI